MSKQKTPLIEMQSTFVITTACGGDVETSFVTARSEVDVKRALLANHWHPNNAYFYGQLGLQPEEKVLAVLIGIQSGKRFFDLTPADIGSLVNLRGLVDKTVIAILPDDIIDKLFDFAFTGGEGEQEGIPGHEWETRKVESFFTIWPSIYREFNAATLTTEELQARVKACGFSKHSAQPRTQPRFIEDSDRVPLSTAPISDQDKVYMNDYSEEYANSFKEWPIGSAEHPSDPPSLEDDDDLSPLEDEAPEDETPFPVFFTEEEKLANARAIVKVFESYPRADRNNTGDMICSRYSQKGVIAKALDEENPAIESTGLSAEEESAVSNRRALLTGGLRFDEEDDWGVGEATMQYLARVGPVMTGFTAGHNADFDAEKTSKEVAVPGSWGAGMVFALHRTPMFNADFDGDDMVLPPEEVKSAEKKSLDLSADEVRKAAKSLIKKHRAYLGLIFAPFSSTLSEALYDEKTGWHSILGPVDGLENIGWPVDWCQRSFYQALDKGLEYHGTICGTIGDDGRRLGCNTNTESHCAIWDNQQNWFQKQQLTDIEARVLGDVIRRGGNIHHQFDADQYTADTIVQILCVERLC